MKKTIKLNENQLVQIIKKMVKESKFDLDLEGDVKNLRRILNYDIFLDEMPGVNHILVREYNNKINIMLIYEKNVDKGEVRSNSLKPIFNAVKMAGVDPELIDII